MLVKKKRSSKGWRFDITTAGRKSGSAAVGALSAALPKISSFGIFDGMIRRTPTRAGKTPGRKILIGDFTKKQFLIWQFKVLGGGGDTRKIRYSLAPFGGTFNCYTWTAKAATDALLIQLLPI